MLIVVSAKRIQTRFDSFEGECGMFVGEDSGRIWAVQKNDRIKNGRLQKIVWKSIKMGARSPWREFDFEKSNHQLINKKWKIETANYWSTGEEPATTQAAQLNPVKVLVKVGKQIENKEIQFLAAKRCYDS